MSNYKSLNIIVFVSLMFLSTFSNLNAQDYGHSVGLKLGTYVGTSFSSYVSENRSFEVIAGITRQANQTDYIFGASFRFHTHVTSEIPTLNWYSGFVAFAFLEEESGSEKVNLAPGVLLGMEYTLEYTPVNFFIEVAPYYDITTKLDSRFDIHANLGVRYVLNRKE